MEEEKSSTDEINAALSDYPKTPPNLSDELRNDVVSSTSSSTQIDSCPPQSNEVVSSSKTFGSPILMFGGATPTKTVKSALFEFGCKPSVLDYGFDSPENTRDNVFCTAQNAVKSAIEVIDTGLQEEDINKVDGDAVSESKNKVATNDIDKTCMNNWEEVNIFKSINEGKIASSNESDNKDDNDKNNPLKLQTSGIELGDLGKENCHSEAEVDTKIDMQEESIAEVSKINKPDSSRDTVEERSQNQNVDSTMCENTSNISIVENEEVTLVSVDGDEGKKLEERVEIISQRREKVSKNGNESINNLNEVIGTSSDIQSDDSVTYEKNLIENNFYTENFTIGMEHNGKVNDADEDATKEVTQGENDDYGDDVVVEEMAKLKFSKSSPCDELMEVDSFPNENSRIEFIEHSDGSTLAVTLENVEVSVFEKGSTDDFSSEFLKSLREDEQNQSLFNDTLSIINSQGKSGLKLTGTVFSPNEETCSKSSSNIDYIFKKPPEIVGNNKKDLVNLDDASLFSSDGGVYQTEDCKVRVTEQDITFIENKTIKKGEELMEAEHHIVEKTNIVLKEGNFGEKDSSKNDVLEMDVNGDAIKEKNDKENNVQEENYKKASVISKSKTDSFINDAANTQTQSLVETDSSSQSDFSDTSGKSDEHSDNENDNSSVSSSKKNNELKTTGATIKNVHSNNTTAQSTPSDSDDDVSEINGSSDIIDLMQKMVDKNGEFRKNVSSDSSEPDNLEQGGKNVDQDSNETEVISLVDDDDDESNKKKKPAAALKCINPNCMSGKDLDRPAMFVLTYFGLKRAKDQEICAECFNIVLSHQENLARMLKERKPLFNANFPTNRDVILLDSDEESFSEDEGNLSDDTMEMIRENLDDVIAESLVKYGLDHQIRESCDYLNNKVDTLEEEAKELTRRFDEVQSTLDQFRKCIYEDFNQPIEQIEEVHFIDCEIPPMPIIRSKTKNQLYNKELMRRFRRAQEEREESSAALHQQPVHTRTVATKKVNQGLHSAYDNNLSQDVIALHSESRKDPPPNLPPSGVLVRPKLRVGDLAYTMRVSYFSIWVMCRVIEVIPRNTTENDPSTETYRVRLENVKKNSVRSVTGKYLAYPQPARVQLKVGTRVIAIFKEEEDTATLKENYYVGVIAEPPKSTNKYRYLVFFDDGYTQYCPHNNILVVCSSSKNVWEDIHPEPRDFIKNYLQQYPERPMVKMSRGQVVKVEWNGRWWIVRVLEVDASLVKVHFDADKRTEWIYRGSTRLGPMYQELAAAKERQSGSLLRSRGFGAATANKSDMPYVEYTRGDGDEKKEEEKEQVGEQPVAPPRSVARKSTAKKSAEPVISNSNYTKPLLGHVPEGTVTQRTLNAPYKPIRFRPHQCNRSCVAWTNYSPAAGKQYDPLIKPLMFGFARLSMTFRGKTTILYKAPCGRMIRSQQEMLCYLQGTKSALTIDLFDFDFWVNVLNEFKEGSTFGRIEDLSYEKENMPISCVNELDHSMPQYVQYMTARQPAKDVNLNLEPEFLVGCDCKDDCEDRSKCSCWQLTMQGKAYIPDGDLDPLFGYQYRRLPERIATGIYECNSKCKCSSTCLNRVAQQPLSCRLQLFKTPKKGWGIRCLHDIPRGAFICIYAGFLLTEQEANEGGKTYGDEYLAELDYIESVENLKEGYESEAREMSDLDDDENTQPDTMDMEYDDGQTTPDSDMDFEETVTKNRHEDIRLRLRRRTTTEDPDKDSNRKSKDDDTISISDDEAETVRKPQTFNATITETEDRESKYPSVRDLYGRDEYVYIMDAKTHGNIGRYLNHSCSPNVFVQNVFVDTHDLRFPWVAFFANQYISAGTELTWDYNYDVGSVPGKVMLCYCGSSNCRGRLL